MQLQVTLSWCTHEEDTGQGWGRTRLGQDRAGAGQGWGRTRLGQDKAGAGQGWAQQGKADTDRNARE